MPPRATTRPRRSLLRAVLALLFLPVTALVVQSATPATAVVPSCASAGYTVSTLGGPNFYIDTDVATMRNAYTGYRVTNQTGGAVTDLYVSLGQFTGGVVSLASNQTPALRLGDLAQGGGQSLFWYLAASGATSTAQNHVVTVYRHDPALPTAVPLCTTTGGFAAVSSTTKAAANKVTTVSIAGGAPRLGSTFTITVTGDTGTIGQGTSNDAYSFWMTPAVTPAWPADAFRLVSTSITLNATHQSWSDLLRVTGLNGADGTYSATYTFRAVGFTTTAATVKPVQQITSGTQIKYTGTYPTGAIPAITPPVNDLTMGVVSSPAKLDTGGGQSTYTATVSGTAGAQLDGFDITLPTDASVVTGSATWSGQPIDDPVAVDGKLHVSGPFTVPSGGGVLRFKVLHGPTAGNRQVVVQGVVGPSYVGTTATVLDGSNAASATTAVNRPPVAHDTGVVADGAGAVTVPVTSLGTDPDSDPLSITSVSAPSAAVSVVGGAVQYAGSPPPAGEQVSFTVDDGRGGTASGVLTVYPAGSAPITQAQTLTASVPSSVLVGDTVSVSASASSGLAPVFVSTTTGVCSVDSDGLVIGVAAGSCDLEVSQPGDATWEPAPVQRLALDVKAPVVPVIPTGPVAPADQTIVVAPTAPTSTRVDTPVTLPVTTTSSLAPVFASATPSTCTVGSGAGQVVPVSTGTCTITVDQPGDVDTNPAPQVQVDLEITPIPQTVTGSLATTMLVGDTLTATASATSGLTVSWTSLTPAVCTVDPDGIVDALAPGACTVRAEQEGDDHYAAATPLDLAATVSAAPVVQPPVVQPPVVAPPAPAEQSIALSVPAQVLAAPAPVAVSASATSGLPVALAVVAGPCALAGGQLVTDTVGSCTIEATQPGDASYAAATAARAVVQVVRPSADTLALPAGVTSPAAADVLANDPAGLTVTGVGAATHGRSMLTGLSVGYLPDAGFRGTDRFTYTVRDGLGRTATADVDVTVANADPTIAGSDVAQVAGTTASTDLVVADPNGDDLDVVVVSSPPGVDATVRGGRLLVTSASSVSGDQRIRLRVRDGAGGAATTTVVDRVSPPPVPSAARFLTASGTRVSWAAAATRNARYEVLVDGEVRCRTQDRSCGLSRIVGPAIDLTVRVLGADATRSTERVTTTSGAHRVLMATVYFAPAADQLTPAQERYLDRIAQRITTLGFTDADLDGYTDSDGSLAYNVALSHRRTATVAQLLRGHRIGSDQSWHGMDDPAASNDTAKGKSANRRVEIYVGF